MDPRTLNISNLSPAEISILESWLFGKSKATVRNYLYELKGFFEWFQGFSNSASSIKPSIESLTTDIFNLYLNEILIYRSKAKRARVRSALGSLFQFLFKTGAINKNPFDLIPSIKTGSKIFDRYLSRDQVQKMIDLENNLREKLILKTLYQGAFRVSELVSIRWSDVSISYETETKEQVIYISVKGKGAKKRTVTLFGSVVTDLIQYKKQNELKSDFLFFSREEGNPPIHKTRINGIVKKASIRAGILKKVSPHWLRHAHATHAIEKGAPLHLVRDTLGHSSIQTTGIYLDMNPEESSGNYLIV